MKVILALILTVVSVEAFRAKSRYFVESKSMKPELCGCGRSYIPICATASTGWSSKRSPSQTFSNHCFLECQNEVRRLDGLLPLTVLCDGPCKVCEKQIMAESDNYY